MRVIAGSARSIKLMTTEGLAIRPTTDRTKETLFNMINQGIYGATFLDIFSGSGAIGIEALSRGAKDVFFVENSRSSIGCIRKNLERTNLLKDATILNEDYAIALERLKRDNRTFDYIFLDPPYNKEFEAPVINKLADFGLLKKDGIIICESSIETDFSFMDKVSELEIYREKKFKTSKFTFIRQT